jgi:hypothetical protein
VREITEELAQEFENRRDKLWRIQGYIGLILGEWGAAYSAAKQAELDLRTEYGFNEQNIADFRWFRDTYVCHCGDRVHKNVNPEWHRLIWHENIPADDIKVSRCLC